MSILENGLTEEGTKIPLVGSASHKELLRYADECFGIAKNNRLQFEKQWYLNIAFYFGKQYLQWLASTTLSKLVEPPAPSHRVRLVSNQVRRYVRKEISKATQEAPTGFVIPASGDDTDLLAARAGDAIIEHINREIKLKREIKRAAFFTSVCGTSFIKDWYEKVDPDKDTIGDMPHIERVTPFHLFVPDVTQEEIESQPYVIHAMSKDADWVKRTYGKEVAATGRYTTGNYEEKFLQAMGVTENQQKQLVYVKEMWIKPGGKYKDGALIVWANDTILFFEDAYPYSHGEYPFSKIEHIPTGRFYAESMVTDLIPLQKEYNRTRSQIIEAKNRMAKPQLLAVRGSIEVDKVTSAPGQIIEVQPGYQLPTPLPLQNLPNYVLEELDRNRADMDDISSQHEVSRGGAPAGVEAATAISYLQEQDDSVLSSFVASLEDAVEKIGRHCLFHVSQNWDTERQIQVIGMSRQMEAFEFSKANLNGNTDYTVQSGSATPRSQAAKQAFIMELLDRGAIPPQLALKYLEMAETGRLYEEMQIDQRHSQRENLKMSMGQGLPEIPEIPEEMLAQFQIMGQEAPTPELLMQQAMQNPEWQGFPAHTWDNHVAHLVEHDNWRKRQEYENSPEEIKALFEKHVQTHKAMLIMLYGYMPPQDPVQLDSMVFKILNNIPITPVGMEGEVGAESGQEQSQPVA